MYYFIALIFFLLSFFEAFFKNTNIKLVFYYISFGLLFILQAFNTWSLDKENYEGHFYYISNDSLRASLEPMHIWIIELVKGTTGRFEDFIMLYGILIMFFLFFTVKRISPLPTFVISCIYIIPFYPDILQIRFFLAFSLFLVSILFFEKRKLVFYIFYGLAICSHFSLLIMIPFFIIRKFKFYENYKKNNLIILFSCILLTIVSSSVILPLVNLISPKHAHYLELVSMTRFLGTIALFLPFFLLNVFCIWHYKNRFYQIENKVSEKYRSIIPIMIQLIQYSNFIIIPQYFVRDFFRVSMNLSILCYAYISICIFYGWSHEYNTSRVFFSRFYIYIWGIFTFYLLFLMLNNGEYMETVRRTIESNSILDSLFF